MHIGTDIVKISRIEKLIQNQIPCKIYTDKETEYINSKANKAQTAAGIYAAKEAVLKCIGTGIRFPLTDISIEHNKSGMPFPEIAGDTLQFIQNMGIYEIGVSISHDGEYALATACAKEDKHQTYYKVVMNKFKGTGNKTLSPECISHLLPKRKKDSHKGTYGRLFVLAGSVGLTGAAIMACTSALRCGAGLITLGCAEELNTIFETTLLEVMTKPLKSKDGIITKGDITKIKDVASSSDVCLAGPGLGRSGDMEEIIENVLSASENPVVLDADAIFALSCNKDILKKRNCPVILTPHIGEFSNLTGIPKEKIAENPVKYGCEFSKEYALTLVLKSHKTIVCTKDGEYFENILGNPGMATGGTGDVLAGCVASFAAQGMSCEDAAKLGVYIHSLAADMAEMEKGEYSLAPTDIIEYLSCAIKYSMK